ncbi:MAG: PA2779 family protein [Hyphomicrobiales bacterium]
MLLRVFRLKSAAVFMTTLMFMMAVPCQAVKAALVPTEEAIEAHSAQEAREVIHRLLARDEVQNQLKLHGIDPAEARARVDSLSDAEAIEVANHVDQLPAGGSTVGIIVGAILLVFLVLLITDLLGLTDVFPFVKKHR